MSCFQISTGKKFAGKIRHKSKQYVKVQVSTIYPNVRSNTCSKELSSNIKIVFFVARETLCDSAVADKAFNFHVVNGRGDNLIRLHGWSIPYAQPHKKQL